MEVTITPQTISAFSVVCKATAVAEKPQQSFMLDKEIVAFIMKQINSSRNTMPKAFYGLCDSLLSPSYEKICKLSAISSGEKKQLV